MPRTSRKVFEVEIRGSSSPYHSNTMEGNADTNVLTDEIHAVDWRNFEHVRFYAEDDHDVAFDVDVDSADLKDADYSGVGNLLTLSLANGQDASINRADGPLGLVRYAVTGVSSAPTSGSLKIVAQGLGHE